MNEATAWYLGLRTKTAIDASGRDYWTPGSVGALLGGGTGAALSGGSVSAKPLPLLIGAGLGGLLGGGAGAGYEAARDPSALDRMKTLVGMSPYDEYGQSADQKITNAMLMAM
jgi:hypothetical protein